MNPLTLDHLVIAVDDLDGATVDYAKLLGRDPSWRGEHPAYGTRNTLFRIDNTYIELLGLGGSKKGGRWAGELQRKLEQGEGLYALALGTPHLNSTVRSLREHGLEVQNPADGEGLDEISGARREWRNAYVAPKASRNVRLFFIEHKSPPEALPPAPIYADEGSYVKRMDHAVVLSADMEAARHLWGDVIGARLALDRTFPERDTRILFFRLADITIEISGGARQTEEGVGKPDRLWGVAWGVDDIEAACARLRAENIDVAGPRPGIKPGTLVATVKGPHTHGVPTLLIEHTPQSFEPESRAPQGEAFDNTSQRRAFRAIALDHVVLSTRDAVETANKFSSILSLGTTESIAPESTPVRLLKIPAGNTFLELLQPLSDDHRAARSIEERGQGMYAIAIEVDSIDAAVIDLRAKGYPVSEIEFGAWPGTRVARINPSATNGVPIQLVERQPDVL